MLFKGDYKILDTPTIKNLGVNVLHLNRDWLITTFR